MESRIAGLQDCRVITGLQDSKQDSRIGNQKIRIMAGK